MGKLFAQLLYSGDIAMALIFVISPEWALRSPVRAQLRDAGFDARGMNLAEDVGRAFGAGDVPDALVVDATTELVSDARITGLIQRIPTVLVASRVNETTLPTGTHISILYRPVRVAEIVAGVKDLLAGRGAPN